MAWRVVSCGSHLSADKLNIYIHETCDWLYLSARASISIQSTTDDQVVPVRAFVQLLQAVIASTCCRTISGLTKVLVRPAMTLHTWSRIVMRCISSNRCFTPMAYFDLKALAICWHCYKTYLNIAFFYNTSEDRIVPPPWRGAGRFVAWLSTSGSNYSKTGSCLWSAAPVEGVLMIW